MPAWALWLIRFQVGVPYLYGGFAKINPDWLRGEPIRMWLAGKTSFPILGQLFTQEWMVMLFSYGGLLIDQYYGQTGITDVRNYLEFTTNEENGLGADLPAGRIRVYQEDIDGAALLIGENTIDHTPEGEEVEIFLGNAFDLVGERIQTNYNLLADTVLEETYEIHLRNRKDDQPVEIRVPEHLFRWSNWEILNASADFNQLDSNTIEFRVEVPPQGETVITYTVRYTWPR